MSLRSIPQSSLAAACVSDSKMLLYASRTSIYLPTTAMLTRLPGLTTHSTNFRSHVSSGFGRFKMQEITYQLVDSLGMQCQRDLVIVCATSRSSITAFRNAAEHRQLATDVAIERFFPYGKSATCGCRPISRQLCHALLSRLVFNSCAALIYGISVTCACSRRFLVRLQG